MVMGVSLGSAPAGIVSTTPSALTDPPPAPTVCVTGACPGSVPTPAGVELDDEHATRARPTKAIAETSLSLMVRSSLAEQQGTCWGHCAVSPIGAFRRSDPILKPSFC